MSTTGGTARAEEDDALLLEGLRERRASSFEQLMRRYNRLLFRAARGIVADDAEAQDVVQEAWLKAFTRIDGFRGESTLATWLFFNSSRRQSLFGAAAVLSAGAVALLAGRSALAQAHPPTPAQLEADVRILNTALAAELEAVAAYQLGATSGLR